MSIIEDILWKLAVLSSNSTLLLSDCIDLVILFFIYLLLFIILFNLSEPRFSYLNKIKVYTMRK